MISMVLSPTSATRIHQILSGELVNFKTLFIQRTQKIRFVVSALWKITTIMALLQGLAF